jgi:hypothetical protein
VAGVADPDGAGVDAGLEAGQAGGDVDGVGDEFLGAVGGGLDPGAEGSGGVGVAGVQPGPLVGRAEDRALGVESDGVLGLDEREEIAGGHVRQRVVVILQPRVGHTRIASPAPDTTNRGAC